MKNRKGFTLIELLSVIVIVAVISAISVPIYNNLMGRNDNAQYKEFEKLVANATKLYMDGYGESISSDYECFRINYETLLKEGILKEEGVTCEGSIVGSRVNADESNFSYKYYLTCKDSKGKVIHDTDVYNNNCIGINKKFTSSFVLKIDGSDGESYDGSRSGNFTNKSIYQEFSSNNAYFSGIQKYQYNDGDGTWHDIVGNSTVTNSTYYGQRCIRAVDNDNNISAESCYYMGVDHDKPTISAKKDYFGIGLNVTSPWEDYFNVTYGPWGGKITCKYGETDISNTNKLTKAMTTLTCVATGNNGIVSESTTINFKYEYAPTITCEAGGTMVNGSCNFSYTNNATKCGCQTYKTCTNVACGTYQYGYSCTTTRDCYKSYCCDGSGCSGCSGTPVNGCGKWCGGWERCTSTTTCYGTATNSCATAACGCQTGKSCTVVENNRKVYTCPEGGSLNADKTLCQY